MAIIKQSETFLKQFGSIRPTSGGKGYMISYKNKVGLWLSCSISFNRVVFEYNYK